MSTKQFPGIAAGPQGAVPTTTSSGANSPSPVLNGGTVIYDAAVKGIGAFGIRTVNAANLQTFQRYAATSPNARLGINVVLTTPTGADANYIALLSIRHTGNVTGSAGSAGTIGKNPDGDIVYYEGGSNPRSWPLLLHTAPGWTAGGKYRIKGVAFASGTATTSTLNLTIQAYGSSTVLGTLSRTDVSFTTNTQLQLVDIGIISANNAAGFNPGHADLVLDDGATVAPADVAGAVLTASVTCAPVSGPVPRQDGTNGTDVAVTVSATGGNENGKTYAIKIDYSANGQFTDTTSFLGLTPYQASGSFEFTPEAVGSYRVTGYARQAV